MCSQVVQIHYLSLMNTLSDSLIFSRQSCNFTKGFNIDSLSQLVFWWSVKGRKQTFLQTKTDKIFWTQKVKVGSKDLIKSILKKKLRIRESLFPMSPDVLLLYLINPIHKFHPNHQSCILMFCLFQFTWFILAHLLEGVPFNRFVRHSQHMLLKALICSLAWPPPNTRVALLLLPPASNSGGDIWVELELSCSLGNFYLRL